MDTGTVILLLVIWIPVLILFVRLLYVEAKQTSWGLLEALIAANILGHVIAYSISKSLEDRITGSDRVFGEAIFTGFAATMVAAFMASGAVWVFRRLKMLNESRRGVRIGYMVLGLLLFPSMVAIPFNFLCGWMVWIPLVRLSKAADKAAQHALFAKKFPGVPQHRYTVAWSKNTGGQSVAGQQRTNGKHVAETEVNA